MALRRLSRCVGTLRPGCRALRHQGRLHLAMEVPQAQAGDTGLPSLCLRTVCGCLPLAVAGKAAMLSMVQGGSGVQALVLKNLLRPAQGAHLALPWGQEAVLGLLWWLQGLPRVPGGAGNGSAFPFPMQSSWKGPGSFQSTLLSVGFHPARRSERKSAWRRQRAGQQGPAPRPSCPGGEVAGVAGGQRDTSGDQLGLRRLAVMLGTGHQPLPVAHTGPCGDISRCRGHPAAWVPPLSPASVAPCLCALLLLTPLSHALQGGPPGRTRRCRCLRARSAESSSPRSIGASRSPE